MEILVSKTALLDKLKSVGRIIQPKNTLPAYDNFLFVIDESGFIQVTAGEEGGLCKVGDDHVSHSDETAHIGDGLLRHSVIELAVVGHNGVGHHQQVLLPLAVDELPDDVHLLRRGQKAGGDAVEGETQVLPNGDGLLHVFGGVQNRELPIVQGVGHQGGGQVVDAVAEVGQNGQHGGQGYLTVAGHVVDD